MELPNDTADDLLPESLLHRFEPELRKRFGANSWEERKKVEQRINQATGLSFLRFIQICIHRISKTVLGLVLGLLQKRAIAIENCWATTSRKNILSLPHDNAKKPIRILHLSDFHLDTKLEQAEGWAEIILSLEFDIAVITGDFFNGFSLPDTDRLSALKTVVDAIECPIYGIFGNHDCSLSAPYIESLGIRLLLNESTQFQVRDSSILLTGIDDPHFFKSDDLEHALSSVKEMAAFDMKLLLVHAPADPIRYANAGFDLCLCGHTHGGQLCTPNSKPLLRNGLYANHTISGNWESGSMKGFTSRGTGTGRLSYRLNCPPEIVVHEVHRT